LTDQLSFEKAQEQVQALADRLTSQITRPADLDTVGAAQGLAVQETGLFARDEPIMGLGGGPEVATRAFLLNPGEMSGAIPTQRGVVFMTVTEKKDSYVPQLDEAKDKVRDTVLTQKAREMALQKAETVAARVKGAADFEKAAKSAGFETRTTELIARDSPIPELGVAPAVTEAAFALPQGGVSGVIPIDAGAAVVKVVEKQEIGETEIAANRDQFRQELLSDRRNRFFSAYMVRAKQKMKIDVNRDAVKRVLG
jgi:hypothetical protein